MTSRAWKQIISGNLPYSLRSSRGMKKVFYSVERLFVSFPLFLSKEIIVKKRRMESSTRGEKH